MLQSPLVSADSLQTPHFQSNRRSSFQEGVESNLHEATRNKGESDDAFITRRKELIVARRGVFRWLHVMCSNDLVYGSWYYVVGSVLCILIPIVPLVMIYDDLWGMGDAEDDVEVDVEGQQGSSSSSSSLPAAARTAVYSLLIVLGALYTAGSYAFLRAVESPRPPALFEGSRHAGSDELLGMWCVFLGTVLCVPITALHVAYDPTSALFWLSLLVSVFFNLVILFGVRQCYPRPGDAGGGAAPPHVHWVYVLLPCLLKEDKLAPLVRLVVPKALAGHVATDWLILSWLVFAGCVASDVISLALLVSAVRAGDHTGIFDWASALIDMAIFTIGSMYFLAGSYPEGPIEEASLDTEVAASSTQEEALGDGIGL